MNEHEKVIEDFERYYEQLFEDERRLGEHGVIMNSPEERLGKIEIVGKALGLLKEQDEVIRDLLSVGYPHDFQREQPWIIHYMYAITDVIKKAVHLNNKSWPRLKPCPFCGSAAETTFNTKFGFQVFCTNENCFLNDVIKTGIDSEEAAIEEWNRRTND